MSNEELATMGTDNKSAMAELYRKNKKIIYKYCNKFISNRIMLDDLMQEGYFALIIAVKAYNCKKEYNFITYFAKALKWHFIRYVSNGAYEKEITSLDETLKEDAETTKAQMIPDEQAEQDFEQLIDNISLSGVFEETKNILEKHSKGYLYKYIEDYYIHNMSCTKIAEKYNKQKSSVENDIKKAMRVLQNPSNNRKLNDMYYDVIGQSLPRSGLNFFRTTGTSGVEWAVMELDRKFAKLR